MHFQDLLLRMPVSSFLRMQESHDSQKIPHQVRNDEIKNSPDPSSSRTSVSPDPSPSWSHHIWHGRRLDQKVQEKLEIRECFLSKTPLPYRASPLLRGAFLFFSLLYHPCDVANGKDSSRINSKTIRRNSSRISSRRNSPEDSQKHSYRSIFLI